MTCIFATREAICADRQNTNHGLKAAVKKLRLMLGTRWGDLAVGAHGDTSAAGRMFKWLEDGAVMASLPDCQGDVDKRAVLVALTLEGRILIFSESDVPMEILDGFYAAGAGADFAVGAYLAGARPDVAVEIACMRSAWCGLGVDGIQIHRDEENRPYFAEFEGHVQP